MKQLVQLAAFVVPVVAVMACQQTGAAGDDTGPMTAADTIALGIASL